MILASLLGLVNCFLQKKKEKEPIQMFRLIEKLPFKKSNFYHVTPEEILTHLHMINETYLIA